MIVVSSSKELMELRDSFGESVGFVPTMGALHNGHISLVKRAKKENAKVVISIFVNPTQFLEGEDFEKYPRKRDADINVCQKAGVDVLFMPEASEIYSEDGCSINAPKLAGYKLEGHKRPGHFDGVCTVVMKLLNIVNPTNAYFGKKDAQQLLILQKMAQDLFLRTNIVACETERDVDGLALSSRNVYLSKEDRILALQIPAALKEATKKIMMGEYDTKNLIENIKEKLIPLQIDYVEITDRGLHKIERIEKGNSLILIAAKVGETRLIDNMWI